MTSGERAAVDYAQKVRDAVTGGRLATLFDLTSETYASRGGFFEGDVNAEFHRLREAGPVHEGIVGPLVGYHGEAFFEGLPFPELAHYSVFDFATCDLVFRDDVRFRSSPYDPGTEHSVADKTILYMDGERHRRYRLTVQPSFMPRQIEWWLRNWVRVTVEALCDLLEEKDRADLNVEFCAPIPLLTICGSFGVDVAEALDIRDAVTADGRGIETFYRIVRPIVAARRESPADDLVSLLVRAELPDDEGDKKQMSDDDVLGFAYLLLGAGSGTTWKQMGITLNALLERPDWLARVRQDRAVLRPVIDESLRWSPTDPVFARFATQDLELGGHRIEKGAVVHMCLGAANRDPARWERPDEFDPSRPPLQHLGFGNGHHICLGQHVAKAELTTAISVLLERFPNLRFDPDAEPPRTIGMYERGPTAVPVVYG